MRLVVFLLMLCLQADLKAQEPVKAHEIILKVPTLNQYAANKIGRQLACVDGLHYSGYYQPANCIFLKYDSLKIPDPTIINIIIHHLNNKLKVETISGYSIYEIIDGKMKW
ncbi:hypothetical protein BH11BAC2_BH11BAC2_25420 [soil metagenome]